MKRMLLVHHGSGLGGGLVALLGLLDELKQDYQITVLCVFDSDAVSYIRDVGVTVIVLRSFFYRKVYRLFLYTEAKYNSLDHLFFNSMAFVSYLLNLLVFAPLEFRPIVKQYDIVYMNSLFLTDWCVSAKNEKNKVVIHVREPMSMGILGIRRWLIKTIIRYKVDAIIAITRDNAMRVGMPNKTFVVYDPVFLKRERKDVNLKLESINSYFLYLGGEQRIKGFEQLAGSVKYLDSNIRIIIAGYVSFGKHRSFFVRMLRNLFDPYYNRYLKAMRVLVESNQIVYVGLVDNIFDYVEASIAVICPFSKPHAALPILEAYYCGKPVVVSDIQGMNELVNSRTGIFFKNGDSRMLADCINCFAKMPSSKLSEYKEKVLSFYKENRDNNLKINFVLLNLFNR